MYRKFLLLLSGLGILSCLDAARLACSDEQQRPTWDQQLAVELVKHVIAVEEKGELPWDKISKIEIDRFAIS